MIFFSFLVFTPFFIFAVYFLLFQFYKFLQYPKLQRHWHPLFLKLPEISIDEKEVVLVKNVRNALYNNPDEFNATVSYENKKYSLRELQNLWIYVCNYGFLQNHLIFSFEFGTGDERKFLTISYELRKVNPVDFTISKVLFNNFEGHYICATEQDVVFVRTSLRKGEPLHLYRVVTEIDKIRTVFTCMTEQVNTYLTQPKFYRLIYRNCVTEVLKFLKREEILNYSFFDLLWVDKFFSKQKNLVRISAKPFDDPNKTLLQDDTFSNKIREKIASSLF
jgi:hypothetical protein